MGPKGRDDDSSDDDNAAHADSGAASYNGVGANSGGAETLLSPRTAAAAAAASRTTLSKFLPTSRRLVQFANGRMAPDGARVVYIDGAFDVFHPGHVRILEVCMCNHAMNEPAVEYKQVIWIPYCDFTIYPMNLRMSCRPYHPLSTPSTSRTGCTQVLCEYIWYIPIHMVHNCMHSLMGLCRPPSSHASWCRLLALKATSYLWGCTQTRTCRSVAAPTSLL
jgi:hypothetical protein